MNAKDTIIRTTKRLVAEIVGDGVLADEGSRQSSGIAPNSHADHALGNSPPSPETTILNASATTENDRFALLLGRVALSAWPDLPRDAQERLFAAALLDDIVANSLAVFLHDRHPKTAHSPRPTRIA